ncbi:sensor histidine kinase [Paenibacillus cellulositrophicus]|uniref:sensor histidine kinase n=1 Tax=Paenibacillus cellulositrophicus TaxID=562959 RepID=UPI00203A514C|nr:sensor histidine kinase [Paenibacillus cellulositrophicus]MCM2996970.1 sensor histidine kinase [Paenibacillus cellulositrophicus]
MKPGVDHIRELLASRLPIFIWVSFTYVAAVVMQLIIEPRILSSIVFSGIFAIHVLLYWNSYRWGPKHFWLYFMIQGVLIYFCAILMPEAYQPVIVGLLPALIAQSLGVSTRLRRIIFVFLISIVVFLYSELTVGDLKELVTFLPIFSLMLIIVLAYGILFYHQVHERIRIQNFLKDLQEAHRKVEELTLSNERQRMARDLHDTLAQGVAGLIMQLEAINVHMTKGNWDRAQSIVNQSMKQARITLADARRAIDNLRLGSASEVNFKESILDEVQHFIDATGIHVSTDLRPNKSLSRLVMEHSLLIVKESLTNIAKHAQASMVWITVTNEDNSFMMKIRDNGVGFNPDVIGKDAGHYGLLGIQERARLMGGEMNVLSDSKGTIVTVKIPLIEGD